MSDSQKKFGPRLGLGSDSETCIRVHIYVRTMGHMHMAILTRMHAMCTGPQNGKERENLILKHRKSILIESFDKKSRIEGSLKKNVADFRVRV